MMGSASGLDEDKFNLKTEIETTDFTDLYGLLIVYDPNIVTRLV